MLLVPGTGHFYCGSCLRDDWLAKALVRLGHETEVVPLYLPLVRESGASDERVRMGGINMYLQQKSAAARYLPGFVADWLDRPGLLRWASRRGSMTEAPDLGPMTVSMLQGEDGRQARELEKLVAHVTSRPKPDVIVLSNAMLTGSARALREATGAPVVCSLQGEAPFLDALPAPWSERSWAALRASAESVCRFVAVSRSYGELMVERLGLDGDRVAVIHNGLETDDFVETPPRLGERRPKTIGYLARICHDKGADQLVEAFLRLKRDPDQAETRLRLAGVMLDEDRPFVDALRRRVAEAGFEADLDVLPNVAREEKLAFLRTLSVFSVPASYGESFGLYVLEALAAGVPVVQPDTASFPELIEATGGGLLVERDDSAALAEGLATLLRDPERAARLAESGRAAVLERFTADRMARDFEDVCRMSAT